MEHVTPLLGGLGGLSDLGGCIVEFHDKRLITLSIKKATSEPQGVPDCFL